MAFDADPSAAGVRRIPVRTAQGPSLAIRLLSGDAGTPGTPVRELQSLVGVKGGHAELTLTRKAYICVKGAAGGDRLSSYWRQPRTGNCVSVETVDGRDQQIRYAPRSICDH